MSRAVLGGSADFSTVIRIVDSTSGLPEEGVTSATAGLALWYRREGGLVVALTESDLAAADSAHADGGMIHLDDGLYRVDLPDAAVAAGAGGVSVGGSATGMVVIPAYHPIDEPVDVTKISGDATAADNLEAACDGNTYNIGGGAVVVASVTGAVGSVTGAVGSVTGAVGSVTGNLGGNVNGNVAGSVGSVTGAVGSVTGSVGSVTGAVGSVAGSVSGNVGGDVQGKLLGGGASAIAGAGCRADSVTGAVGSVTGAVGSVTGAVGSVTGAVASVTAGVTVTTNNDKTGYALTSAYDPAKTAAQATVCTEGRLAELDAANLPTDVANVKGDTAAILEDTGTTLAATLTAIKAKTDLLPSGIAKATALTAYPFLMVDSTDHVTPETGLTVTAQISKDGGAFAACTNSVAEIGSGVYKITLTSTEMDADIVVLKFTATAADQVTHTIITST